MHNSAIFALALLGTRAFAAPYLPAALQERARNSFPNWNEANDIYLEGIRALNSFLGQAQPPAHQSTTTPAASNNYEKVALPDGQRHHHSSSTTSIISSSPAATTTPQDVAPSSFSTTALSSPVAVAFGSSAVAPIIPVVSSTFDASTEGSPSTTSSDASTDASPTPASADASTDASSTPTSSDASTNVSPTPTSADASTDASPTPASVDASTNVSPTPTSADASTDASPTPASVDASTDASPTPTSSSQPSAPADTGSGTGINTGPVPGPSNIDTAGSPTWTTSPNSMGKSIIGTANYWRNRWNSSLGAFEWDEALANNSRTTAVSPVTTVNGVTMNEGGANHGNHNLIDPSLAQCINEGNGDKVENGLTPFERAWLGWICERPNSNVPCGTYVQEPTGHADIIAGPYNKLGCYYQDGTEHPSYVGLWTCDFA